MSVGMRERGSMSDAPKKNRWPLGIVVVIATFLVVMFTVVGYLMTQDVNLVTEKYYEKELAYQARIKAIERTRALGTEAGIETAVGSIIVKYPHSMASSAADGRVLLYRPSDRSADRSLTIAADTASRQIIPFGTLSSGLWRIQVQWTMRGEEYYLEQPFMVP
jgi:hypothetical protein